MQTECMTNAIVCQLYDQLVNRIAVSSLIKFVISTPNAITNNEIVRNFCSCNFCIFVFITFNHYLVITVRNFWIDSSDLNFSRFSFIHSSIQSYDFPKRSQSTLLRYSGLSKQSGKEHL